jgi:hypothetical protein
MAANITKKEDTAGSILKNPLDKDWQIKHNLHVCRRTLLTNYQSTGLIRGRTQQSDPSQLLIASLPYNLPLPAKTSRKVTIYKYDNVVIIILVFLITKSSVFFAFSNCFFKLM